MALDRDKLAKVLALTTSQSTHEALAAARMANQIIADAGLSWSDVLAPQHYLDLCAAVNKGPFATTEAPIEEWGPGIRSNSRK